ncbi:cupin domain-containing protein [Aureliella helgolandensis]|uniref:Cupin domain protein n=1 Tax=Aureliella helgolandensis TaxID=2527968 RepID=A0A518G3F3_9BACT|nr:cupin domain-containing protein [Aureliella helgolandensis]QDV23118.1 Cupin domain protein [Aureliella helgolandensis]
MSTLAQPGTAIDVGPLGAAFAEASPGILLKTDAMKVRRLIISKGKEIPEHKATGEITVHCIEGNVLFHCLGNSIELTAGKLLYLPAGELHAVTARENSTLLVTMLSAN